MNMVRSSLLLLALAAVSTVSVKADDKVTTNDAYLITSKVIATVGDDYKINEHYDCITEDAVRVQSLDLGFDDSMPLKEFKKDVVNTWPEFNRSSNNDFTRAVLNLE